MEGTKLAGKSAAAANGNGESPLYEVVCPAVYVARVFGLAPYELEERREGAHGPKRLRASAPYCLFSLFWMSVYSYIVVVSMIRFGSVERDKPVLGVTEDGKLILNYLVSVVDMLLCVCWRGRFVRVWNSIQDFDEAFHTMDHRITAADYAPSYRPLMRRAKLWVWAVLAASSVGWTAVNQLGMHAFNEPYLQNVGYMLTYVGSCVAVLKFCGLVMLLGQRFAYLNRALARQRVGGLRTVATLELVKKIESSYNKLLGTSEKLNDIYSWSLLLFLFNLFCHAVSNMYFFMIWTILDPSYLKNTKIVLCLFSWLVIYLIQMLLIHVACHFTTIEANRMARLLLDWRRQTYRQSKYEFSSTLHYLNRKLNFTAAGCFSVDLPLLTSTFGHLTTYLVILLQIPNDTS